MTGRKQWRQLKATFKGAWTYEMYETKVQYRIEAATSIAAPLLVLLATVEVNYRYWLRSDEYLGWVVAVSLAVLALSLGMLLFACSMLEAHLANTENRSDGEDESQGPLRGSPMLVFAAFLFTAGAGFTAAEALEHFAGPIGLVDVYGNRAEFGSPWGDILLAASAICMLVEEFILLTMYDSVKREAMRVRNLINEDEFRKLVMAANDSATKIEGALNQAETHGGNVKKYSDETKKCSDEATALVDKMRTWQSGAEMRFRELRGKMIGVMVIAVIIGGVVGLYYVDRLGLHDRRIEASLAELRSVMGRINAEIEGRTADSPAGGAPEEEVDSPPASDEPPDQADAPASSDEPEEQADAPVAGDESLEGAGASPVGPAAPPGSNESPQEADVTERQEAPSTSDESREPGDAPDRQEPPGPQGESGEPEEPGDGSPRSKQP